MYVQSNTTTLSLDEVTAVIETGFSRGEGGRLRFRSLIVTNPYFRTVVNVEVLNNTSPTAIPTPTHSPSPNIQPSAIKPQLGPSTMPSSFPTVASTDKPSGLPSATPIHTMYPTSVPLHTPISIPNSPHGFINPTRLPKRIPTAIPSQIKVPLPQVPSPSQENLSSDRPSSPTPSIGMFTAEPSSAPSDSGRAIVIGTIFGGAGFVVATLFLVLCICLPFCTGRKSGIDHDPENTSGSFPGHHATQTLTTHQMAVPGVLTLDEDAQSLANTTLDGKSSAPIFTLNQFNPSPQHLQINDSFDESSIYTSTTDPSTFVVGNETFQASSQPTDDAYDRFIGKNSTGDSKVFDQMTIINSVQQEENGDQRTESEIVKMGAKEFDPFSDDNEHFADDESSFEFRGSMALSEPSFAVSQEIPGVALKSDETNRIENISSMTTQPAPLPSVQSITAFQNGHRYDSKENDEIKPAKSGENTPLENFLIVDKDTTTLSTSKSVSSFQSAPSRLVTQRPMQEPKTVPTLHGRPPQHGNRHISNYHGATKQSHRFSASSVGPSFRSRLLSNPKSVSKGSTLKQIPRKGNSREFLSANHGALISRQDAIKTNDVSGFDDPFLNEYVGLQMPSTGTISEINDLRHVLPRQTISVASYREEFDSPTMNSSRYGNDSSASSLYDSSSASGRSGSWMLDTDEHTLDSDPRIGDYHSAGSRSSHLSRRRHTQSEQDRDYHVRNSRFSQNGMVTTNGGSNRSTMDEQKSADHAAGPYSRQSVLGTYGPSSISSSSTTGSGSRSTLSSRVDTHLREQYEILAPPGKINIVLVTDFHNGNGTVISKVRATSAMQGKLCEGDELGKPLNCLVYVISNIFPSAVVFDSPVAIDGDDVTNMVITEITAMMASRAGRERKLTVLRDPSSPNAKHFYAYQETKHDGNS